MGGKNHQPTKPALTAASAWLSQQIGKGCIAVQKANNHLEDVIMLGMGRQYIEDLTLDLAGSADAHLSEAIESLHESLKCLANIQVGFARLAEAAAKEGYKGNPLAGTLPALKLRESFTGVLVRPFPNDRLWAELERRIETYNVMDTLAWEAEQFQQVAEPTRSLVYTLEQCKTIASKEGANAMAMAVENGEVPLRQYFAQVFSLWNSLDAMFLYSALIMTELFYRANAYPSLLDFDPASASVHAA